MLHAKFVLEVQDKRSADHDFKWSVKREGRPETPTVELLTTWSGTPWSPKQLMPAPAPVLEVVVAAPPDRAPNILCIRSTDVKFYVYNKKMSRMQVGDGGHGCTCAHRRVWQEVGGVLDARRGDARM